MHGLSWEWFCCFSAHFMCSLGHHMLLMWQNFCPSCSEQFKLLSLNALFDWNLTFIAVILFFTLFCLFLKNNFIGPFHCPIALVLMASSKLLHATLRVCLRMFSFNINMKLRFPLFAVFAAEIYEKLCHKLLNLPWLSFMVVTEDPFVWAWVWLRSFLLDVRQFASAPRCPFSAVSKTLDYKPKISLQHKLLR